MNTINNFHMYKVEGNHIPIYTKLHNGSIKQELINMRYEVVNNDVTIGHYDTHNCFYSNKDQTKLMHEYYNTNEVSDDIPF